MSYNAAEHIVSHGKKISYADTSNGSFTQIYGNFEIDLPDGELSDSETTNDDSPDFAKTYQPGMYDWGKATFKYKYGKTQFAAMDTIYLLATVAASRATATKYWKVAANDGSTWVFPGFITKHVLPLGKDDDTPEVEGEIRVTGKPVFTAGT